MDRLIAKELLSIGAVFLRPEEPFTWASGIKSPIYCDNRLTLSAPATRDKVEHGLAQLVKEHYPECEMLMGTSTAGIAHAAITATLLGLPMGYVRGESKSHGRNNRIEGRMEPGTKVVVVEDLISTGGSAIDVVEALRLAKEAGALTICITNLGKSPIIKQSDLVLNTASEETRYTILGMNSRIAQLAIIDTIYAYLILHRDKDAIAAIQSTERALQGKKY